MSFKTTGFIRRKREANKRHWHDEHRFCFVCTKQNLTELWRSQPPSKPWRVQVKSFSGHRHHRRIRRRKPIYPHRRKPLNGSAAIRSVLPVPTRWTEQHQHTLCLRSPRRREGAWNPQPLPPPPRLRLLPTQVYWPRQPGVLIFRLVLEQRKLLSSGAVSTEIEIQAVNFVYIFNENSLFFSGRCICYVFQPSISNGSVARPECECLVGSTSTIHDEHWELRI